MLNSYSTKFTVGIVGLGLIGGSLAKRLVKQNCTVYAYNRHTDIYSQARETGIICVDSVKDLALKKPSVLILCNSLASMPSVLKQLENNIDQSVTTLSDVGSVKDIVRNQVKAANLGECYVGAHPMAGSEFTGWKSSYAELLDNALWALTVDSNTKLWRVANVLHMITNVCKNRAIVINDDIHDKSAALISHMPHVVSTALANVLCDNQYRNIAIQLSAGSWRDMTRVSLTDPNRTRAMVSEDRHNVAILLRSLIKELDNAATMLEDSAEDADSAEKEFFAKAQPWREYKYAVRNKESSGALVDSGDSGTLEPSSALSPLKNSECDSLECDSLECDSVSDWREKLLDSAKNGEEIIGISSNLDYENIDFSSDNEYSYNLRLKKNNIMMKFMGRI
ncbi:prephenate dehydrogenase [Gardnerella vaginalis]|uniref:prephenate dehydrogenase n=1 Tax=Gardnerella vaginalis TaxID=2702 RepID=UPI0039EE0837